MAKKTSRPPSEAQEPPPALRTVDMVVWVHRNRPERFTMGDLMREFGLQRGEVYRRMQYLKLWGLVRSIGRAAANRRGPREIEFALTKWGMKYCEDRKR